MKQLVDHSDGDLEPVQNWSVLESRYESSELLVEKSISKCKSLCEYFKQSCLEFERSLGLTTLQSSCDEASAIKLDQDKKPGQNPASEEFKCEEDEQVLAGNQYDLVDNNIETAREFSKLVINESTPCVVSI